MRYILCSDLHLRNDKPLCRLDEDWIEFQRSVVQFVVKKANEYSADIVFGGDIYNSAVVPYRISNMFLQEIRKAVCNVYILDGNHSAKYHREEFSDESSIGALKYVGGNIIYLTAKEEKTDGRFEHSFKLNDDVTIIHTLAFPSEDEVPFGAKATTVPELFEKYDTDFLLLGDNHHSFVVTDKWRTAINPGCTTVQTASQIDYAPCIYYIDTGTRVDVSTQTGPYFRRVKSEVKKILVPHDPTMVTADHLSAKKDRDERISAFVEVMKKNGQVSLSFEENLRQSVLDNSVSEDIMAFIEEVLKEIA